MTQLQCTRTHVHGKNPGLRWGLNEVLMESHYDRKSPEISDCDEKAALH